METVYIARVRNKATVKTLFISCLHINFKRFFIHAIKCLLFKLIGGNILVERFIKILKFTKRNKKRKKKERCFINIATVLRRTC